MAYSNHPSRRPDPSVAPIHKSPTTGRLGVRAAFTPSTHLEAKNKIRELKLAANRKGGGR